MRGRIANAYCTRCGHHFSAHADGPCDVEVTDYGDLDCGCTGYFEVALDGDQFRTPSAGHPSSPESSPVSRGGGTHP